VRRPEVDVAAVQRVRAGEERRTHWERRLAEVDAVLEDRRR
jgi:hypothetical protein